MYIKNELRMRRQQFTARKYYAICSTANTSFAVSRYRLYENPMEILQSMLCQKALNPM